MNPSLKSTLLAAAAALAAAIAIPETAGAWIFSGDVLIHKVGVARRNLDLGKNLDPENAKGRLRSLEAKGSITLKGREADEAAKSLGIIPDKVSNGLTLRATARLAIPGKCSLELFDSRANAAASITASNKNGAVKVNSGEQRLDVLYMFAELICPILDGRGGYEGPMSLVKAAGVNRFTVTMGRAEREQIAYVIGGTPVQDDRSSFWVAKDIFQPVRFVDKSHEVSREVRLIDYSTQALGRWYPKRIEFLVGGEVIGTLVIDSAVPNPKLSDEVF